MFAVNSSQPQIAAVLAQIPAILNHVRTKTFSAPSSHRPHQQRRKEVSAQGNPQSTLTIEEIVTACNACLDAKDIHIVPSHVTRAEAAELASICEINPLKTHTPQLERSHVSASTFFENKTGFPESAIRMNYMSLSQGQMRFQHLLNSTPNNINFQQRRGFVKKKVLMQEEEEKVKATLSGEKDQKRKKYMWIILGGTGLWCLYLAFKQRVAGSIQIIPGNHKPVISTTKFSDVQGNYEAKQELEEIVDFLRDPERFTSVGAKLPKGVLLVGPPGVGKTLLARAVAGESNVPFFQVKGSEFDEMFVGSGARKVRNLFESAKNNAPCVIFIDEIDSVGSKRTNSTVHPYANQTINQLLDEMDGFRSNSGVIVMGATNRREFLDSAITRAGRFDVEVKVSIPVLRERKELFSYYLGKRNIKTEPDVDTDDMARNTVGFTGADIENLVNQAALHVALASRKAISAADLEFAREKLMMGPAKKFKVPDAKTNRMTAYHEAGHTLVTVFTENATPLYKVTIQSRGQSLGHTAFSEENDKYVVSKAEMLARLDVSMGGRVAEEIVFGKDNVGTGASADFQNATRIAKAMVESYGMSDKVGPFVVLSNKTSKAMQDTIDSEIRRLLSESYERARVLLTEHRKDLNTLAKALLEYETLDKKEVMDVLAGKMPLAKTVLPTPNVAKGKVPTARIPIVESFIINKKKQNT